MATVCILKVCRFAMSVPDRQKQQTTQINYLFLGHCNKQKMFQVHAGNLLH